MTLEQDALKAQYNIDNAKTKIQMTSISFETSPKIKAPNEHRVVRNWLYLIAAVVAVMVLVGGATRLTDSGLSITEWKPVTGMIPPLSQGDWESELEKYRTTTEYQVQNKGMSMADFQTIYWWEWGHRFLGRMIGILAVVPLIFFWVRGMLPSWLKPRLILLVLMGGSQGAIGWWMVKSGLVNRVDVSQIRLAIHLTMACIIFAYAIWLARSLATHTQRALPDFSWQGAALSFLILVQIFLGGLVAGLDAGMAYNTWPTMNGELIPQGLWSIAPTWKNFTDNALTVQFVHRLGAHFVWGAALFHMLFLISKANGTAHARRGVLLFALVSFQALMGIVTLILQVPMSWALAHQLGALIVLAVAISHWQGFKPRTVAI